MQNSAAFSRVLFRGCRKLPGIRQVGVPSVNAEFVSHTVLNISLDTFQPDRAFTDTALQRNKVVTRIPEVEGVIPVPLISNLVSLLTSQHTRYIPKSLFLDSPPSRLIIPVSLPVDQSAGHQSYLTRVLARGVHYWESRAAFPEERQCSIFLKRGERRAFVWTGAGVPLQRSDKYPPGNPSDQAICPDHQGGRNGRTAEHVPLQGGEEEAEVSFNRQELERLEGVVRQNERRFGGDHDAVADACLGCAIAFMRVERGVEAERYCERVLAIVNKGLNRSEEGQSSHTQLKEREGGPQFYERLELEGNQKQGVGEGAGRVKAPGKFRAEVIEVASEALLQMGIHFGGKNESLKAIKWAKASEELLTSSASGEMKGKDFLLAMSATCQGMAHMELGQLPTATSAAESALDILSALMGPEHPYVAQAKCNVAHAYVQAGRLEEAEVMLRDSLRVRRKVLGRSHQDTILVTKRLLSVAMKLGHVEEGRECLEELRFFGEEVEDESGESASLTK